MRAAGFDRRRFLRTGCAGLLALGAVPRAFGAAAPVLVGLDAEFFDPTSTADDTIRFGAQHAIDHINARGGVLGGRPLQLVTTDNRSLPARGVVNVQHLATLPDLVAYLCGKFSPVALEQVPHIHAAQLPLLNPWSAADAIVDNNKRPNYAFRLGLRDSIAMERLLAELRARKLRRVGLILPTTAWGRSCQYFTERYIAVEVPGELQLVGEEWHRWGSDRGLDESYGALVKAGADAILFVGNEPEGASLVRAIAALPERDRRPLFSHWGITGGRFPELCGPALHHVELEVAQSFSFAHAHGPDARPLAAAAMEHFGVDDPLAIPSMTGLGPAYDLVRLLALAIGQAGSTHRPDIQRALERLPAHQGVVKRFAPAFAPERHEALGREDVLICRFDPRGRLLPSRAG